MKIPIRLGVELRRSLGEKIQRRSVARPRSSRASREGRLHAGIPRKNSNDAGALEIVERMQQNRVGDDEGHAFNLMSGQHASEQ